MIYGITYLNKHSFREMGIMMPGEKKIGMPAKIKNIQRIPFSNVEYDFSFLYGEQTYTNRKLSYNFNIGINNDGIESMNREKKKIVNWLMQSKGKQPLYDDAIPGWHFLAEVEDELSFEEDDRTGILTVTFTAYPFMIRNVSEGDDLWDTFDFDNDVSQTLSASFKRSGYADVPIGSYATLGAWATNTVHGPANLRQRIGASYKVLSKHVVALSLSYYAYKLEGIEGIVYEQDIVQAFENLTELTIINNGSMSVAPTVDVNTGVSIIKENIIYNFQKGKVSDSVFRLEAGENKLKIVSLHPSNITFEFYKEMI